MKFILCQILFCFFFSTSILAQGSWGNIITVVNDSTSSEKDTFQPENLEGTWNENTNMSMKLTVNVESGIVPYELGFYLGQHTFEYLTPVQGGFMKIDVRYDNEKLDYPRPG